VSRRTLRTGWHRVELKGRVALVTGGGRRVGRALAEALGARGATVGVHYNESESGAKEAVAAITEAGGRARAFGAQLTQPAAPAELIAEVVAAFGQLDVLINSAAVMVRTPFGQVTVAQWDEMFALNLRAPFMLSQAAAPQLKKARGAIVNIADLAAFETWPGYIPHGITKAGVVQMTRNLAQVLAPEVRVNGIAPGTVLLPDDWDAKDAARLEATTPLKRSGTPADVASAMLYLLDSEFVTGETIVVDGGRHVRGSTT
jgi:pteridine reductase